MLHETHSQKDFVEVLNGLLANAGACPNVVIGPVVWRPSDGQSAKRWYFMLANTDTAVEDGFYLSQIDHDGDYDDVHGFRTEVARTLADILPIVIHITDDELSMARLCETLWPCERLTEIREQIEADAAPQSFVKTD